MGGGRKNGYGAEFPPRSPGWVMLVLLVAAALLSCATEAGAQYIMAVRGFSQTAGVSYSFLGSSDSSGSHTREHDFTEDYGMSFSYILWRPQLVRGETLLDLEWQQKHSVDQNQSHSASDFRLRYNIRTEFLSKSPLPVTFSATSSHETVPQAFAPSYNSDTEDLNLHLAVRNARLPVELTLDRQSQETSGVNQNYRQNADSYSISVKPHLSKYASLNLGLVGTESESTALATNFTSKTSTLTAHASDQTSWFSNEGLGRSLSVSYNWQGSQGTTELFSQDLNSALNWQLGKALEANLSYSRGSSHSAQFENHTQAANGSLMHHLGGSLTTSLSLSEAETDYQVGSARAYGAGLAFAYHKILTEANMVNVGYASRVARNERTGEVSVVQVVNESHPIPALLPRLITLANATFDPQTIEVTGAQTRLPYPASNFVIVPEGIQIVSFFPGDSEVLVSYSFLQDPSVTTVSISHAASWSLSLEQGKYRIYGNGSLSSQHQEKGTATLLSLTDTRHFDLGMNANISSMTLGTEAGYDKNFNEDLYYLNTSWGTSTPWARGNLSLNAADRYTWQSVVRGGNRLGGWTNTLNVQSDYRRSLGIFAGRVKLDYANSLVEGATTSHTAVFGFNLEGKIGKLLTLLYCSATWNHTDRGTATSEGVGFSVRRRF